MMFDIQNLNHDNKYVTEATNWMREDEEVEEVDLVWAILSYLSFSLLYSTLLYCTLLYCTLLHSTVLYCMN